MWEDYLLSASALVFSLALLPSLLTHAKPARATCALTTLMLILCVCAYIGLNLFLAAGVTTINLALWAWLWIQPR